MRKTIRVLCVLAAVLFCLGCLLVGGAVATAKGGWKEVVQWAAQPLRLERGSSGFWVLEPQDYYETPQERVYESRAGVDTLVLQVVNNDVELIPRANLDHVRVTYYLRYADEYAVEEAGSRLTLSHPRDNGGSIHLLGFLEPDEQHKKFTVEYPAGREFALLELDGVNNKIRAGGMSADRVSAELVNATLDGELDAKTFTASGVNSTYDLTLKAETVEFDGLANSKLNGTMTAQSFHANSVNSKYTLTLDVREASFDLVNTQAQITLAGNETEYAVFFEETNSTASINGNDLGERTRPDAPRSIDITGVNSGFHATTADRGLSL